MCSYDEFTNYCLESGAGNAIPPDDSGRYFADIANGFMDSFAKPTRRRKRNNSSAEVALIILLINVLIILLYKLSPILLRGGKIAIKLAK